MRPALTRLLLLSAIAAAGCTAQAASTPSAKPAASGGQIEADLKPSDVIHWQALSAQADSSGTTVKVALNLATEQGFTIYKDKLKFSGPLGFSVTNIKAPPTRVVDDPTMGHRVEVYVGGEFEVTYAGLGAAKGDTFPVSLTYVGCSGRICLFPHTENLEPPLTSAASSASSDVGSLNSQPGSLGQDSGVLGKQGQDATVLGTPQTPQPVAPATASTANATARAPTSVPILSTPVAGTAAAVLKAATSHENNGQDDLESRLASRLKAGSFSFGMLLLVAFLGGLLTNATPCVYPMIPITVRLLGRQGMSPVASSVLYAAGILVTYTLLGSIAALSGSMFGGLMASKTFNLVFAVIMAFLGLSMLGFGNLAALQNIGSRLGSGKPSATNTFLMGSGAGLVAAPCTGPILAALLAYTAGNQDVGRGTFLLFIYSLGFSLPYVFLGGAAARLSRIQVAPQVQTAVKLLFASIMFGLAFYYLRIPAYPLVEQLRDHWAGVTETALSAGVILLLSWLAIPYLRESKQAVIAPTLVFGLGIFGLGQWVTSAHGESTGELHWQTTEAAAFAEAQAEHKPILVDSRAEWCEACKEMEATTFRDPLVVESLRRGWVLLKLDLTESTQENEALTEKYDLQSLPTVILLPPDGSLAKKQAINGYVSAATLLNRLSAYRLE